MAINMENNTTPQNELFSRLVDTVASFTSNIPGVRNAVANQAIRENMIDVTAFNRLAQFAEIRPQANGNLFLNFTDLNGKTYHHSFNMNDAAETRRLQAILDNKDITPQERFSQLTSYFTSQASAVKTSHDFAEKMEQGLSQHTSLSR